MHGPTCRACGGIARGCARRALGATCDPITFENVDEGSVVSESTASREESKTNANKGERKHKKKKVVTDEEKQQTGVNTEVALDSGVDGSTVSESTANGNRLFHVSTVSLEALKISNECYWSSERTRR